MKQISRLSIQRMIDTSGSAGSGGSGGNDISLAGYATEAWVEENYLSKEFFLRLFGIHGTDENDDPVNVEPNDPDTTITDIEAKYGFWSDSFVSAFGLGEGGGGGTLTLNEPLNRINIDLNNANPTSSNRTLVWNGSKWTYKALTDGSVTSVGMSVPTGFSVTGSPITSSGTLAISFATGYSLPLTADVEKGVTAYGWGNHANAGYALASNVYSKADADARFLTISFFRSLFKAYQSDNTTEVVPNNGDTSLISSIKAMFGLWTEQYLSSLGQNSSGGGIPLNEPLASINSAGLGNHPSGSGQTIIWNGSAWVYGTSGGSVQSISINGGSPVGPTNGVISLSGLATTVKVGDTSYTASSAGVVSLPDYLKLTGGELSLSSIGGFSINRGSNANSFVTYKGKVSSTADTLLGNLGFSGVDTPAFRSTGGTNYTLWHAGNFTPSNYVPTNSTRSIVVGGGNYNFYSPSNTALNLDSVYGRLAEYDSGGGTSSSSVDINTITTPGVYAGYGSYYYIGDPSVALPSTTYFRLEVSVTRGTGSGTYLRQRLQYYNNYNVRERRSTDGGATWTGWAIVQRDLTNYPSIRDSETANYVFATPNGSAGVPSFRKLVAYDIDLNNGKVDVTDDTEFLTSYAGTGGFDNSTHQGYVYRRAASKTWNYIKGKITADTTLNVASATKLQTARTLWGQDFDGTADVNGELNITGRGSYRNGIRIHDYSNVSSIWLRAVNNSGYDAGMIGITGDATGLRFCLPASSSGSSESDCMNILYGGNVGIGTTSPSYKLDVNGTFNATGNSTVGGTLGVTGAATLSSTLTVAGTTTLQDNVYISNNKYIYYKDKPESGTAANIDILRLSSSNNLLIGHGVGPKSYDTYLQGYNVYLRYGTSRTTGLTLSNAGLVTLANNLVLGSSNNTYIKIGGLYLSYDSSNNALRVSANSDGTGSAHLYATGAVSAFGIGSSSSGLSLCTPLNNINTNINDNPTTNGATFVWNGNTSKFVYSNTIGQTLTAYNFSAYTGSFGSTLEAVNMTVTGGNLTVQTGSLTVSSGTATIGNLSITKTSSSGQINFVTNNKAFYLNVGTASNPVTTKSWTTSSDIRLKNIVSNAGASIEQIADAPIFNFRWKSGNQDTILGSSAQYWQSVFPCAVRGDMNSFLSMDYGGVALAAAVITARKVVKHEDEIAALKQRVSELENELNELKAA